MRITKAVIPIAGFGTRFLPATLFTPKVMIPILDKPPLHYSVEEASESGIDHVILVISENQQSTLEYFQTNKEIEDLLKTRGDRTLLESIQKISDLAEISLVIQQSQLGLGHAIYMVKSQVGEESFAVLLPDDLILSDAPTIGDMIDIHVKNEGMVIALREVPEQLIPNLGIADISKASDGVVKVKSMVEKPNINEAPSKTAIIGRYILPPAIFDTLENISPGVLGEIQLTDALSTLLGRNSCYGFLFPGAHFDVGTPTGLLKASIHMALNRDDSRVEFRKWLAQKLKT